MWKNHRGAAGLYFADRLGALVCWAGKRALLSVFFQQS
jgi:hypothetical protein